jgi:hypothetical protein
MKENIKTSAKESLGLYDLKQHKYCFVEESLILWMKGSRLNYYWYRIQIKGK